MTSVQTTQLPKPPINKQGWPWTIEELLPPDNVTDKAQWPRVSIITPSYNQAQFIEETIRSVLLQGYPNLEYMVMDGGSTDGTAEILRKYEPHFASLCIGPDGGQSAAINQGSRRASGDIIAWLNSDDYYLPGAIFRAVNALSRDPHLGMVYSDGLWVDERGGFLKIQESGPLDAEKLLTGATKFAIPQPTVFMRRFAFEMVQGLDESLNMAMDLDLWLKLALHHELCYLNGAPIAALRFHSSQKTQTRVLEDRLISLAVLDRALADARCPKHISRIGNAAYARLCVDISRIYLYRHGDYQHSLEYLLRAIRANPGDSLKTICLRTMIDIYRKVLPVTFQTLVRRARGTTSRGSVNVRN